MAKLDVYKITGNGGGAGAVSPVVVHATRSNIKAFAGIQYSLKGIQSTLTSMERIELDLIENDKLREIAERRRKRREADRLAEEQAEKGLGSFDKKADKGKLTSKDKKKVDSLFGKLFSGLGGLATQAFAFLLRVAGLLAVKSTLEWLADPENRQKLVTFFEKASFVFNKIAGIVKFLVVDSLLEGISQTFGKDKTFGERVGGLWKIITGIVGLSALLNPFGTMDAILTLLGLDFYRDKTARVADALDDAYIDGPDGKQRRYRKNPRTGKWEEIGPNGKPVKPGTGTGTTKPGTTKLPTTKPGGNQIPKNQRLTPNQMASNLQRARLEQQRQAKVIAELRAQNKTLLGRGTGSNIAGRGLLNIPKRTAIQLFGKSAKPLTALLGGPGAAALKAGVKTWAGRVPWVGGIITAAIGLLDGDPIEKVAFETIGALIGGAIGTAIIPIPILGPAVGMMAGEYAGDLAYMFFNKNDPRGGGVEGVKRKIIMDARGLWEENILPAFRWSVNALKDAGAFIQTSVTRMWQALPKFEIPEVDILGFKIGGFKILDPSVLALPYDPSAAKKLFDQAFDHDKQVEPIKVDAVGTAAKAFKAFVDFFKERQRAGQTGGRSAQKAAERERNRLRAAQRAEEEQRAAALKTARDAFLEKFKIRAWDNTGNWRDGELAYKDVAGWFFGGTKEYYVRQEGGWNKVEMYGPLTRRNFNSDEAFNFFKLGGGNAQLKRNRYDVKEVVMRGFNAGTNVKKVVEQQSKDNKTPPPVSTTVPNRSSNGGYWTPLLELIAAKEAVGGSYDSIYPGTTKVARYGGRPLTDMTIDEANQWQLSTYRERGSAAAGRYQFMNILGQARAAGLRGSDKFSAANQDKMAIHLLMGKRKITADMIKNNPEEAMIRLGMEWAAFPMPRDMQGANRRVTAGQSYYAGDGRNKAGISVAETKAALAAMGAPGMTPPAASITRETVTPITSFVTETDQYKAPISRAVGQKAILEGKPVIWDGAKWIPDPEGGSEDSPTKSEPTTASDDRGYAILPYQSSQSDTALPPEQAKAIAEGILDKKYSAYDLGTIGGLKEGGLSDAVERFKNKGDDPLGLGFNLMDLLGLGEKGPGAGGDSIDATRYPSPGEDGYAGPKSGINPLDYNDKSGELTDNTGKRYSIEDVAKEIFGDPEQNKGPVNPDTYGGTHGFDLRDLFPNNRGLNPYGPDGQKVDMWTNSTGWQDDIPGWGDYTKDTGYKTDLDFGSSFKTSGLDFSKAFGFSKGGKVPNNLKPFFLGGLWKGIKKAFNGVVKAVSNVVSGVGNFLSSPIGNLLTTAVGVIFPPLAPVIAGIKAVTALASGDIIGAITNTVGALTGFFPETMGNFFQGVTDTLGSGLGGVVNGFLKGGIGGAIGGLGGMLPAGVQKFFGGVGKFIQKNPTVGAIIKSIPGVANIPGLANLFGLEEFPGMPGPIGIARTLAGQFGMGGVFDALAGIAGMTQQTALMQQSPELGVDPRVFGIFNQNMSAFDPKSGISGEYAMQTALEFVPIPLILLKLVPIDRPVPINNTQYIPQKAPAQQQQPAKK